MAKQDLISAILKRKELFTDIVELEESRSKNAAQDKQEREKAFYATLDELKAAKRRAREILKLPSNEYGETLKKEKALVKRMYKKLNKRGLHPTRTPFRVDLGKSVRKVKLRNTFEKQGLNGVNLTVQQPSHTPQ